MNRFPKQMLLCLVVLIAACTPTPTTRGIQATPSASTTQSVASPAPTEETVESNSGIDLTLWVAPIFSPEAEGPAAGIFMQRLSDFEAEHEGVNVIVRIRPASGSGSLLETLEAAMTAAPGALPDLISLNPAGLYSAALKGWVVEMDSIQRPPDDSGWFEHALAAADIDGQSFGVPFASQAEVLIYHADRYLSPPQVWGDLLAANRTFLFPAGDREAGLTLSQYLRLGGELYNQEGRPMLDGSLVASVLEFYATAQSSNLLPATTAEMVSTNEAWQEWLDGQADSAIVPLSLALENYNPETMTAAPIPSQSTPGFSLSRTWCWAIVSTDPARQELTLELIDWLSQPEFLGQWTYALRLMPPDPAALDAWPAGPRKALVEQIASTAVPYPGQEELATFGPALYSAVQAVIASDLPPASAAEEAIQLLTP